VRLHLPLVRLITGSEVARGIGVVLERPQQPIQDRLPKSTTVGITQGTSVSDGNVALPRGNTGSEVFEVALALIQVSTSLSELAM
jgi:hypothetical protein